MTRRTVARLGESVDVVAVPVSARGAGSGSVSVWCGAGPRGTTVARGCGDDDRDLDLLARPQHRPVPLDDLGRPGVEPDREAARGVPGSDRVAHDPPLVGADAVAAPGGSGLGRPSVRGRDVEGLTRDDPVTRAVEAVAGDEGLDGRVVPDRDLRERVARPDDVLQRQRHADEHHPAGRDRRGEPPESSLQWVSQRAVAEHGAPSSGRGRTPDGRPPSAHVAAHASAPPTRCDWSETWGLRDLARVDWGDDRDRAARRSKQVGSSRGSGFSSTCFERCARCVRRVRARAGTRDFERAVRQASSSSCRDARYSSRVSRVIASSGDGVPAFGHAECPPALARRSELGSGACRAHAIHDQVDVAEVQTDDLEVLEPRATEVVLADDVTPMSSRTPVSCSVVLSDDSRNRVQQVRDSDQSAAEVEDGLVAQGSRQSGVQHPDESHPGLVGRHAVLVCEVEGATYLGDPLPARTAVDVRPHLADRGQLGRGRPCPSRRRPRARRERLASRRRARAGSWCTGHPARRSLLLGRVVLARPRCGGRDGWRCALRPPGAPAFRLPRLVQARRSTRLPAAGRLPNRSRHRAKAVGRTARARAARGSHHSPWRARSSRTRSDANPAPGTGRVSGRCGRRGQRAQGARDRSGACRSVARSCSGRSLSEPAVREGVQVACPQTNLAWRPRAPLATTA